MVSASFKISETRIFIHLADLQKSFVYVLAYLKGFYLMFPFSIHSRLLKSRSNNVKLKNGFMEGIVACLLPFLPPCSLPPPAVLH